MVGVLALWLPILVAAVLVFVASSIIHMLLPYHRTDFGKVPDEDAVMDAMRGFNIPAGDYVIPRAGSPEAMKSEEFREKAKKGPVWFMTVLPDGDPFAMGSQLAQWFVYCVIVGIFPPLPIDHIAVLIGSRREPENFRPDSRLPFRLDQRSHALIGNPPVEVARDPHVVGARVAEANHDFAR